MSSSCAARPTGSSGSPECDVVCVHNCVTYPAETVAALAGKPALRYWHDLARVGGPGDPALVRWALEHATSVFTSPLHRDRFPHQVERETHVIPPPIDLARFRPRDKSRPRGACWLGSAMHAGKGLLQAFEWAEENEPVDFWGVLPEQVPDSPRITAKGLVPPEYVPKILGLYRRFVFLPTTVEPFGRAVVEAWAAGCELILNRNVGALHWLEHPDGLRTAAADFWRLVGEARDAVKLKLLIHSNAPWSPSGYGQQVALFAPRLADYTDLAISAFHGLANAPLNVAGLTIYPGSGTGWGNDIVHAHAEQHFGSLRGGLVLSLVDVFVLEPAVWRELNVAAWVPVDHDPAPPAVFEFFAATGAVPIAMSRFGQEQLRAFDALYVPHGVATDVYRPEPRAEARAASGFPRDAFVVGIVGVNKGVPSRKSLAEMIEAFAAFRERHDDAVLYLHTEFEGLHQGTNLPSLLADLGVPEDAVLVVDQSRYLLNPFAPEELAAIYSSLDVLLNASMGEGFGLTVLEAQACGVPAIVTDFTAMSEVCGAGWKVGYERHWTDQASWQARPRVDELVESLEACYALDEKSRRELSARARDHALQYDADRVLAEHWLPALEEVAARLPGLTPPLRLPS